MCKSLLQKSKSNTWQTKLNEKVGKGNELRETMESLHVFNKSVENLVNGTFSEWSSGQWNSKAWMQMPYKEPRD